MKRTTLFLATILLATTVHAQRLTSPKQFFGQEVGADYYLSNYTQFEAYWKSSTASRIG